MMAKVRIESDGFIAATGRDLQNTQRDTWAFAGRYWHRNYKAVHFTKRGARLYKYTPRRGEPGSGRRFKGSYTELKLLRKPLFEGSTAGRPIGEVKPLVWSGMSRSAALASRRVEATARSSGHGAVDIIFAAPNLNRTGKRINMVDEVKRVHSQEVKQMELVSGKYFERRLTRIRRKRTSKGS